MFCLTQEYANKFKQALISGEISPDKLLSMSSDERRAYHFLKRHYLSLLWDRFEVADGLIIKSVPSLLFRELLTLQQVFLKTENNKKTGEIMPNPNFIIKSTWLALLDDFRTFDWAKEYKYPTVILAQMNQLLAECHDDQPVPAP